MKKRIVGQESFQQTRQFEEAAIHRSYRFIFATLRPRNGVTTFIGARRLLPAIDGTSYVVVSRCGRKYGGIDFQTRTENRDGSGWNKRWCYVHDKIFEFPDLYGEHTRCKVKSSESFSACDIFISVYLLNKVDTKGIHFIQICIILYARLDWTHSSDTYVNMSVWKYVSTRRLEKQMNVTVPLAVWYGR